MKLFKNQIVVWTVRFDAREKRKTTSDLLYAETS